MKTKKYLKQMSHSKLVDLAYSAMEYANALDRVAMYEVPKDIIQDIFDKAVTDRESRDEAFITAKIVGKYCDKLLEHFKGDWGNYYEEFRSGKYYTNWHKSLHINMPEEA